MAHSETAQRTQSGKHPLLTSLQVNSSLVKDTASSVVPTCTSRFLLLAISSPDSTSTLACYQPTQLKTFQERLIRSGVILGRWLTTPITTIVMKVTCTTYLFISRLYYFVIIICSVILKAWPVYRYREQRTL